MTTFPIPTYSDTFDLCISDPTSLLNAIADRYSSTERILMEFVDNAIDDAEALYRASAEAYPYEIRIEIVIDLPHRLVTIRDNCRGMQQQTLERIVANVGESRKKGHAWLNGQFGYGVHAFRAAAEAIRFHTKHADDDHLELYLRRDQEKGIRRPRSITMSYPSDTGTGTEVIIGPFHEDAFRDLSILSVKQEIERHFERLLARPGLTITVRDIDGPALYCEAFDYGQVGGEEFQRTLELEINGHIYPVEVYLKVADQEAAERTARFFARGRRINAIADIKTFISKSRYRTAVWGHPNLLGYIEVGELVRPVITRDDFTRSEGRKLLYNELLTLESMIKDALDRVNEAQRDNSLNHLETILCSVLDGLAHEDRLSLRSELVPGHETGIFVPGENGSNGTDEALPNAPTSNDPRLGGSSSDAEREQQPDMPNVGRDDSDKGHELIDEPLEAQGTRRSRAGFDIRFSALPADLNGTLARSKLVDGTIYINVEHPDFKERMEYTRKGRPKFNDRLGSYLAATVSIHYKDQIYQRYGRQPDRRDQMFDEQVAFMCRFEAALRPCLPHLEHGFGDYGFGEDVDD